MKEISQKELFSNWSENEIKNVYYFLGEEKTLKNDAVKKLKDIIKPDAFNFSAHSLPEADISSVLSEANTLSVFSNLRMIVLDGLEKTKTNELAKIENYLKDPSPGTCLVLISDKKLAAPDLIAKSSKTGILINFAKLSAYEAQIFLRGQIEKAGNSILPRA